MTKVIKAVSTWKGSTGPPVPGSIMYTYPVDVTVIRVAGEHSIKILS